ncbi:uncharacterized protein LOC114531051, partial [Dendronephthya gigantea]|uniref:uncharacterized protein LOC114531051 n=1 Tax=Dendronephthya gigantea TaxID=151771 RepID=UPI00106AFB81
NQNPNLDKFRTSCLNGKDFKRKLKPSDIKLISSAMAMSAAALSPYLGKHEAEEQNFTHILTLLGMEMAANLVYDMGNERNAGICHWVCLYIGNFAIFLLIGIAGIVLWTFDFSAVSTVVITAIIASLVLVCILISACFNNSPTHSWLLVHLPIYRFVNSLLNFIHHGSTPPAMLHLSDGGHFENYGLLPLLKLRLPRILVADGSHIESEDDYAKEIIQVMEYAREILDCSFTAMDGGDVLTDIKNKYVHPKDVENQKYPRMYKFKVLYSESGR